MYNHIALSATSLGYTMVTLALDYKKHHRIFTCTALLIAVYKLNIELVNRSPQRNSAYLVFTYPNLTGGDISYRYSGIVAQPNYSTP